MIFMKKILKILISKKVMGMLLLLMQMGIFYVGAYALREYSTFIFGGTTVIGAVTIVGIINRKTDSGFKIAWIFLIAVMPVFGVSLYFYVRSDASSGRIKKAMREIHNSTSHINEKDDYELHRLINERNSDAGALVYLQKSTGYLPYANTGATYFPLGDDAFPVMIEEIKKASRFVFIEFFIINEKSRMWNELFDILKEKVYEGVEVRVLYDAMGSMTTVSSGFRQKLKNAGIKCVTFSPIKPFLSTYQNNRDHRKIIVIDGKTAFSGGINLSDEYINDVKLYGHWKDNSIMLKGDAVKSFTLMFLRMWNAVCGTKEDYENYATRRDFDYSNYDDGHYAPFDDSPVREERVGKNIYKDIINTSRDYVYIMTPYLVLDETMLDSLKYASKRGVDVKILMPHIPDKRYAFALARTYYPELIESGVEIYEYTPGFVHSKTTICDDIRAVIGTINYDYRSLYLNYECAIYMYATSVIEDMKSDFLHTVTLSRRYTLEDYRRSPLLWRFIGRVMRVFAPLM